MNRAVGDRIQIVSKVEIRYEGTLHSIDPENNTVSLSNVLIHGTEGRRHGVDEVMPADQLYEFIVFSGNDIKDLIYQQANAPGADPAIIKATPASATASAAMAAARPGNQANFFDRDMSSGRGGRYGGRGYRQGGNYSRGGRGSHPRRDYRESHTGQDFTAAPDAKPVLDKAFDFEKSRQDYEKSKAEFEKAREESQDVVKAYSKDKFFDNISSDQKDKPQGMNRAEMRRADAETFGSEMVGSMPGFHRGRGRGRGGRGRYQH